MKFFKFYFTNKKSILFMISLLIVSILYMILFHNFIGTTVGFILILLIDYFTTHYISDGKI